MYRVPQDACIEQHHVPLQHDRLITSLHGAGINGVQWLQNTMAELAEASNDPAVYDASCDTSGDDLCEMRVELALMAQSCQAAVSAKDIQLQRLASDLAGYQQQLEGGARCIARCLLHKQTFGYHICFMAAQLSLGQHQ